MRHSLGINLRGGTLLSALALLFAQAPAPAQPPTWQKVEQVWNQVQFFRKANKTFHKYRKMCKAKEQYAVVRAEVLRVGGFKKMAAELERAYIDEALSVARINVSEIRRVRHFWRNAGAFVFGKRRLVYDTARSFDCLVKDDFVQAATYDRRRIEAEIDKKLQQAGVADLVERATHEKLAGKKMAYDWHKVLDHDKRWLREDMEKQLNEEVAAEAPIAVIWADKTKGPVPLKVVFSAARSVGVDLSYVWKIGKGFATTMETDGTFDKPGRHEVALVVIDAKKRRGTVELTVLAQAKPVILKLTGQHALPTPVAPAGRVTVQVVAEVEGLAAGESAKVTAVLDILGQSKSLTRSCEKSAGFTWLKTPVPENAKPGSHPFVIRAKLTLPDEEIYTHRDNKLAATVPGSYIVGKKGEQKKPEGDPFVGRWDAELVLKERTEEGWKTLGVTYKFTIERIDASTIKMLPSQYEEPVRVFTVTGDTAHHEGKWTDRSGSTMHETWTLTAAGGKLRGTCTGTRLHKDARGQWRTDPFDHRLENATRLR